MSVTESEETLQLSAVRYLLRHSMHQDLWVYTLLGQAHVELRSELESGELAIISSHISCENWYLFTTRRVIARYEGITTSVHALCVIGADFGNFKGVVEGRGPGARVTEVATLADGVTGQEFRIEFETLYASMALIYACKFWERRRNMFAKRQGGAL